MSKLISPHFTLRSPAGSSISSLSSHRHLFTLSCLKLKKVPMKILVLLTLLGTVLQDTTAVIHSMKFFFTGSSGVPDFPEFLIVGYVDDVQGFHYDSNTKKIEPKQDWMIRIRDDDPDFWQTQTERANGDQQTSKVDIENVKRIFNQTGGVHIFQLRFGCHWDEETGAVTAFNQYGYDGEDFLALNLQTETWIAGSPGADSVKQDWDNNKAIIAYLKNIFTHECPGWLKRFVNYGRNSLMRTDLPSVSLLQKTSTSPITCHATGFYPKNAVMFWRKDGEELHEDVDHGDILPNPDGSFQMSVDLKPPSEPSADWGRYECVFQLSGVKEDKVYRLDKKEILTNEVNQTPKIIGIIIAAVVLLLGLIGVIGFILWKRRNVKKDQSADVGSELSETLNKEPR